jgi:DNA-binding response OmpR family regulator
MRLLLLEDNLRCGELTCEHLRDAGFVVDLARSIAEFKGFSVADYNACIVDLSLPDGDAIDLIREVRQACCHTPILITSGRVQVSERITGLEAGADDYLVKPYNCNELVARIRALLRRPVTVTSRRLEVGALGLDCATGEISSSGQRLELSRGEKRLLTVLIKRRNQVVPKPVLESILYEVEVPSSKNAVEKLVSRLRRRIDATMGVEVRTVRGDGYLLCERS